MRGKEDSETEQTRLADLLLAILDRSAVAIATSIPQMVFGALSGITAEDLMFSTHLGSANMALQPATLSPPRPVAKIPCMGHSVVPTASVQKCQITRHPHFVLCSVFY